MNIIWRFVIVGISLKTSGPPKRLEAPSRFGWGLSYLSRKRSRKRSSVPEKIYFTQLLFNLPTTQPSELSAWLPDQWKLNQSASTTPA
jgi:hypothetical protein